MVNIEELLIKPHAYTSIFYIHSSNLAKLFNKTKFAISTEKTRFVLQGIYLHIAESDHGTVLRAVATDGHRLALCDCTMPDGASGMLVGTIIPRETVIEVLKMLDSGELIKVAVSDTKIQFSNSNTVITSSVIKGPFPDYARVIPMDNTRKVELDPKVFAAAVERLSTITSDRMPVVKITLSKDLLGMSMNCLLGGNSSHTRMSVVYDNDNDDFEIGFNPKYLIDIFSNVVQGIAHMSFGSKFDSPCVILDGDDKDVLYVIMPIRFPTVPQ